MPLPRNLRDATADDVEALVRNGDVEGAHLDFKRELPARDNAAKGELVGDATAFANAGGGDLVYGIEEDGQGRAGRVVPQPGNADEVTRWFQDVLLNNVEPRIPGLQVQAVDMGTGFVLVVRVPRSWAGPHRARTNQHFYVRDGLRKRQLDVPEIRGMFLRTDAQAQRVRDFRANRVGQLLSGTTPVRLVNGPVLMVHLVPSEAVLGVVSVDPVPYTRNRHLPALGSSLPAARLNLDGALAVRNLTPNGETHGYSQFFRDGFFETVKVVGDERGGGLASLRYEQEIIRLVEEFRNELGHLGIAADMTCMVSLTRADTVALGLDRARFAFLDPHQGRFDREQVLLPDVLLSADVAAVTALRAVFDLVWQSAGMERSFNYDASGNWVGR